MTTRPKPDYHASTAGTYFVHINHGPQGEYWVSVDHAGNVRLRNAATNAGAFNEDTAKRIEGVARTIYPQAIVLLVPCDSNVFLTPSQRKMIGLK